MSTESKDVATPPIRGWMRKWVFDGETPHKEKNVNGRWAWPGKFKLVEVTPGKCLNDDVPLVAYDPNREAAVTKIILAAKFALSTPGFVRGRDELANAIAAYQEAVKQ